MKKFTALATAGAMALTVLAVSAAPSQAAPPGFNTYQSPGFPTDQKWKKFQGQNPNWQGGGPPHWQGGPPQGFHQGPPKWVNNSPGPNWNNNNNWWKYKNKPHYPQYPQYPNYNSGIPFVFGLALGALASPYLYDSGPVYVGYTPHQLWCKQHYPNTYNARTNTYYVRPGVIAVCYSPYSGPGPFPY